MTYEECLERIASEVQSNFAYDDSVDADMVVSIMIDRLKEAEELKKAYIKQIPMKPKKYRYDNHCCPVCDAPVLLNLESGGGFEYKCRYCPECGQKILWNDLDILHKQFIGMCDMVSCLTCKYYPDHNNDVFLDSNSGCFAKFLKERWKEK